MMMISLALCLFFLRSIFSYQSFFLTPKTKSTNNVCLYGSRHLGRYGSFVDTFQRPKDKKMADMYQSLNLAPSTDKNGAELKKSRTRNLVKYKQENPYDVIRTQLKPFRFDQSTIDGVLKTLNMILGGRDRSQLSDAERVGVINWYSFDEIANKEIENFETDGKMRDKLISWVKYHIRKGDIVFDLEKSLWKWDPTRLRRHGKVVKTIVPRNQ